MIVTTVMSGRSGIIPLSLIHIFKYAADNKSEMLYIIQDSINGLNDYVSGKNKDFSAVGVKAVDDHTLQITLNLSLIHI